MVTIHGFHLSCHSLFFLLKGEMPISISSEDEDSVMCISWIQLVDWLNECICQIDTIRKIPITEIIMQYKTAIESLIEYAKKNNFEPLP